MRTITRFAAALLAVIGLSAPLLAVPAASWVNFSGGIYNNDNATITYYGGNASYAATVHGSRQADGSVLLTEGGIEIVLPSAQPQVSVIVDMSAPPESGDYDILAVDTGTYTMAARSKSRKLNLLYITNSNSSETDRTTNGGTAVWGDVERRWVTMTHQNNAGTSIYLDDAAAAPNDSGLYWSAQSIRKVKIGAAGQKIYAIYLYTTRLTQTGIATARTENKAALPVPLSFEFSRAGLSADGNTMKVLQVGGGAAKASTFTATLDTTATRVTDGGGETNEGEPPTTFFKSVTSDSASALLTTNGYPMVRSKFVTTQGSTTDEGWSIYLPFTPSADVTVTHVCPQLFAVNPEGGVQEDNKVFGYTVTLYSGSVDATTESPTALTTATGTTISLSGTTVNTQAADFEAAQTLTAGTAYTMKLAVSDSNTDDGSYSGIAGVVFSSVIGRTVRGNEGTWSTGWTGGTPLFGADVTLNVSDAATLSMNTTATLASLTVNDGSADGVTPSLTFKGTSSLTSATTTLNANTDVSAITANLGVVTLASGKTLTVGNKRAFTSLAGTGGTLAVNATKASIDYSDSGVELEVLRTYNGKVIFEGTNANAETSTAATGVTLQYAINKGTMSAKFAFDGGTHTFQYGANAESTFFGPQGTDDNPTLEVKNGATLNFCTKDLSGWQSRTNSEKVIVRVREGSTLNFTQYSNQQGEDQTAYFNNRLVLDNGATVNIQNTEGKFRLNGGVRTEATAQLAMLGGETPTAASVTGGKITLPSDEAAGVGVSVGANATLTIANDIAGDAGRPFAKYGEGTLVLSGAFEGPSITVNAGTLVLSGAFEGPSITVNAGMLDFAVAEGAPRTIDGGIFGAGTVKKSGAGTLSLTGMVSTPVEVAAGTLDLGTNRPTIGGIADEATLKLTATTAEATAGAMVLPTTLAVAPDKARFSVENLEIRSVSLGKGMLIIRSASATPTLTLDNAGKGTWTNNNNSNDWPSNGTVVIDATALTVDAEVALPASGTFDELIVVGSSAKKTTLTVDVNASTTITTLSPSGYVAMTVEAVNASTNAVSVAAGGIFEVTTDDTATLSKAISGAGKFAKGGTGTLTLDANITITTKGGSIVQSGTLKFAAINNNTIITGAITTKNEPGNYTSSAMGDVTVAEGATLDLNGRAGLWLRTITLGEGAIYQNSGGTVGANQRQLQGIRLTGNATVRGDSAFGLVAHGWGATTLDLGRYTLTKDALTKEGSGTFLISNCTVSNGTLKVVKGSFSGNGQDNTARPITISGNVTLERAKGAPAAACFDFTQADRATKPLTIASGATLTTAGPAVTNGIQLGYTVLMGNLVANSDVSPTSSSHPITSLSVAADSTVAAALLNCVTGSTTVESGKTLTLSGTGVSLTKLPTGTGSVKIPAESSVTYANGANGATAYSGWTTVEGELTLACELGFTEDGKANSTYPIEIAQGGTVKLATGGSTYRSFQGKGDIEVTGNATLGIPTEASVAGGFSLKGTITVNAGVTLTVAAWEEDVQALSGANLCVKGTIAKSDHGSAKDPTVKISAGKTLSGTGTISVPVTFENGSVIKAVASGAVTCSGEVTLPAETGTVTVQATEYGAKVLKKSGLDVAKFALPTGESNWKTEGLFTEQGGALLLVAKPTFTPPDGTPAMSDATARVIAKLAAEKGKFGVTTVEVAKGRNPAAVEVFNKVMTVNDNTPTKATISYDFGVADMTIKSLQLLPGDNATTMYVLLAAKVQNSADSNTASFAEGTKLTVLNGKTEITPTPVSAAVATGVADAEETTDVQWLAVPLATLFPEGNSLGTRSLKVKASKASN